MPAQFINSNRWITQIEARLVHVVILDVGARLDARQQLQNARRLEALLLELHHELQCKLVVVVVVERVAVEDPAVSVLASSA